MVKIILLAATCLLELCHSLVKKNRYLTLKYSVEYSCSTVTIWPNLKVDVVQCTSINNFPFHSRNYATGG